MSVAHPIIFLLLITVADVVRAEADWFSFTLDNDIFFGNDNAYTNGIYFSIYDTPGRDPNAGVNPHPQMLTRPLLWSLPQGSEPVAVNSYTIGQAMMTPVDITLEFPPEDDFPYSGYLFLNNSYMEVRGDVADKVSTTIGVVGSASGAEQAQTQIHKLVNADQPKGWDTQLNNELVFQLGRARIWRLWRRGSSMDILGDVEGFIGTIESFVSTELILRFGNLGEQSYATSLLNKTRISNPLAIRNDWYGYLSVSASYTFNSIFLDGNTYRDSRSIEYDPERIGAGVGFSYAFENASITVAVVELGLLLDDEDSQLRELTRFGAVTIALRL